MNQSSPDIVQRLRNFCVWNNRQSHYEPVPLTQEAATEIERLRAARCSAGTADAVLMPREATRAMTMAGCDSLPSCEHVFGHAGEILWNAYARMVKVGSLDPAQPAPEQLSFVEAMSLAERGLEIWKAKEHNAKWWRRIDGTPIPNDLLVNIAEEFAKCGLVYASTLSSTESK